MSVDTQETKNSIDQKVIRASPLLWILAVVLCGLLSSLGTQALTDVADLVPPPDEAALRQRFIEPIEAERKSLDEAVNPHREAVDRAQADLGAYERTLGTAEDNFHTWLQTRATLGSHGTEDKDIRARRDQLEELRSERDQAAVLLAKVRAEPDPLVEQRAALEAKRQQAQHTYDDELRGEQRAWTVKVLGLRLMLVAPVWILAAWLWRRRKRSVYVTLLWGYWAFAIWMLFWGVEPYLPHYGGYAPLSVGVALTVWASISLVRWFNGRVAIRRHRLVEKNISRHRCPGCERGYLVGRETALEMGLARKATRRQFDVRALRPRVCSFCGLRLFGACARCGHEQPMHLERCAACQAPWEEAPLTPSGAPSTP